jgi:hypothetical protein
LPSYTVQRRRGSARSSVIAFFSVDGRPVGIVPIITVWQGAASALRYSA